MSIFRVTKKFMSVLSVQQKIKIVKLELLMIIGGFLEMCSVTLVLPFMNAVMRPDEVMKKWYTKIICGLFNITTSKEFLILLAIVMACIYILKNIYLLLEFNIQYHFIYGNMFEMQRRLLNSYIHRPYDFFLGIDSGEVFRIVNNDTTNSFELLSTIISLFTELVVSGMLIIVILFITPLTTICIAIILLLLLLIISRIIKPTLHKAGLDNQTAGAEMNKWLLQSIQGIKEIKIMRKEEYFQKNYDEAGYNYVNAIRKSKILSVIPRFFIEAVGMGTMFIVVALMIYQGSRLETIIPILTAVVMAAIRLLPSVNRISSCISTIAYSEPMLDKLIENIQNTNEIEKEFLVESTKSEKTINNNRIGYIRENILFNNITFHYPNTNKNILSETSFLIRCGESVGIVGSSGAGKTTVVDILLGLLLPQEGCIFIDGIDISEDMKGWHTQIGYIPQKIFLLDDSIKNNVCFGIEKSRIVDERLWDALEEASLADFVKTLPNGLETQIGEQGVRLSGGQRQRIGIARALYYNPSILVFDEATSALDNETEAAIMDSIHNFHGEKTMIIIAHRLTTLEACDHVYKVDNGKVIQER